MAELFCRSCRLGTFPVPNICYKCLCRPLHCWYTKCWFASVSEVVADIKTNVLERFQLPFFFTFPAFVYTLFRNYEGFHIIGKPEIKFVWNLWFSVRRIRVFWDVTLCPDVSKGPQVVPSLFSESFSPLTPTDPYKGRTAPLTSKRCILYIYSTNIGTEYFKHGVYSPFFLFKIQFIS